LLLAAEPTISELYRDYPVSRTGGGHSYINLTDEFVQWLSFANAGMLNRGNLLCIDYAVANLPSANPIVEIGSFCGLSTNLIAYYMRKHGVGSPLFTCDRWEFEGADETIGDPGISRAAYRDFVRESFIRNLKMFSGKMLPHTIEMVSDDFFGAWAAGRRTADVFDRQVQLGGAISFCYIDGNHSYEFARRDFENTHRFLEVGGFVLFDDSADGSTWEVCRVVEEIKSRGDYRLVVKNPNYLFQRVG
jgi:hypothetical protein